MRRTVEPPPASQCTRCGGQLKLKHIDSTNCMIGMRSNVFACTKCGAERAFSSARDQYTPQVISQQSSMQS